PESIAAPGHFGDSEHFENPGHFGDCEDFAEGAHRAAGSGDPLAAPTDDHAAATRVVAPPVRVRPAAGEQTSAPATAPLPEVDGDAAFTDDWSSWIGPRGLRFRRTEVLRST